MNNIKNEFSIKDLENLSGIKAHTIRIWEKRYNLLQPNRTDTNIRYYSLESLQKLLNVSYLNSNGYKISKISKLEEKDISAHVNDIASRVNLESHAINSLKLSMLNFDQSLFYNTYNDLLKEKSFQEIVYDVFMPFLVELGILWQTDTITPAHEHFLSTLIKQKILLNIEKIQNQKIKKKSKTFVLYLPLNEIHDIGLLFANYEIVNKGYQSIFLGQSVPINSLTDLLKHYENITFISYFTIKPEKENIEEYIQNVNDTLLNNNNSEFWVLGRMQNELDLNRLPKGIKVFSSIEDLVKEI